MTMAMNCEPAISRPRLARGLFRKGFWAVADQGLFSISNCIVNVMLARWLSPTEYGAFATAFAAFLALGVIHTSLLTEPMLVFSPERYRDRHKPYFGALVHGHLAVSLCASAILVAVGWFLGLRGQTDLAHAMYWFAAAGPFILFLWLMRRIWYGQFNPKRAAMGGLGYLVLMMSALAVVHQTGTLTIGTALTMIAVSSLIAGIALGIGQVEFRPAEPILRDVIADHLRYGRWATATQILGFIPANIYYFLLPTMATLEQSGALRALTTLFMPLLQASSALCLLLLPAFVRTLGTDQGKRLQRLSLLLLAGGPLCYWLVLGFFNHRIVELVYGGKYQAYSGLIWILGMQPVIAGMSGVYGSLLRARQQMSAVFWGGVVAAAAAVAFGIEMTRKFGLAGACWSIVLTYALHQVTLWLFSRCATRSGAQLPEAELAGQLSDAA
ncbi:MAG: oligosaccharide flippase family protein [Tepidisphaeraceae bacterium]